MPICCLCNEDRPRGWFSKLQLRKEASKRKCRVCVEMVSERCNNPHTDADESLQDEANQMYERVKDHILSGKSEIGAEKIMHADAKFDSFIREACSGMVNPNSLLLDVSRYRMTGEIVNTGNCQHYISPRSRLVNREEAETATAKLLRALNLPDEERILSAIPFIVGEWAESLIDAHGNDSLYELLGIITAISAHRIIRNNDFAVARILAYASLSIQGRITIGRTFCLQTQLTGELELSPRWKAEFEETVLSLNTDTHLVRFLSKRIPCDCLDAIKHQIKDLSTTCCIKCMSRISSSDVKRCSGCRVAKYCSRSCQKRDYERHKDSCALWRYSHDLAKSAAVRKTSPT